MNTATRHRIVIQSGSADIIAGVATTMNGLRDTTSMHLVHTHPGSRIAGSRATENGFCKKATGGKKEGSREQGAGSREQGTGSREQGTRRLFL